MNTFLKTFTMCLIIALGFLFYKYFGAYSRSKEINRVNNGVFSVQKDSGSQQYDKKTQTTEKQEEEKENTQKNKPQKTLHTCYFYSPQGKLVPIIREINVNDPVESAVLLLLKGPLISETQKGIYTQIPPNVDLINLTVDDKKVIVDLSSNFGNGGSFDSIEARIEQLSATVKNAAGNKDVYLYINGSEVEYLGGDGVYIKQPLD